MMLIKFMYLCYYLFHEMKHPAWMVTAPHIIERRFSLLLMGLSSCTAFFVCTAFQTAFPLHVYCFFIFPLCDLS